MPRDAFDERLLRGWERRRRRLGRRKKKKSEEM